MAVFQLNMSPGLVVWIEAANPEDLVGPDRTELAIEVNPPQSKPTVANGHYRQEGAPLAPTVPHKL